MSKIRVEELETLDGLNLAKVEDLAKVGDPETGLDRRVIYVDTVADLQTLDTSGMIEGQQASVGEAGMFVWSGSEWLPKNSETITVRIPSDYPTLQDFADDYSNTKFANGGGVEVLIESGYVIESQLLLTDCRMGNVKITSEDEAVEVDAESIDQEFGTPEGRVTRPVFGGIRTVMPEINCLFKFVNFAGQSTQSGIQIMESSAIRIAPECGFTDSPASGLACHSGSVAVALSSIFTSQENQESDNNGITAWSGSVIYANGADTSYNYYGARAATGGTLNFIGGKANNCRRHGTRANEGGNLVARFLEAKNCTAVGVNVSRNGRAEVQDSDVSGCDIGVASRKASFCDASGVIADFCDIGFLAEDSSAIAADGSTTLLRRSSADECRIGYYSWKSSNIQAGLSSADGCSEYGYFARHNSTIGAKSSSANGCLKSGYFSEEGSSIYCDLSEALDCGERGIFAETGSSISSQGSNLSGASLSGAQANNGSRMNVRDSNCRRGEDDEPNDVRALTGSIIHARGVTGGLSQDKNTVTASGIIFA